MAGGRKVRNSDKIIYVMLGIYLLAVFSRYTPSSFMFYNISIFICVVACVVWMVSIRIRIVEKPQRFRLYSIAFLILFLHVTQICKYNIFAGEGTVERLLWYAYYIPTTLAPLVSLYISVMIEKASKDRLPRPLLLLIVPAIIQIILIMTNDYHQFAFSFNPGFENWQSDYGHEALFYISTIWSYLIFLISFIIVLKKSFMRKSKKAAFTGLFIGILHYALTFILFFDTADNLKVFGTVPITAPMLYSMTFIIFWESLIHFRLFPSNSGYDEIFNIADISAYISDKKGDVILRSESRTDADTEDLRRHSEGILGGYISWSEDISTINALNKSLREVGDELREGNALLIEEAEVKANRARLQIKNEIYDDIAAYMSPHFKIIENLLKEADNAPEEEFRNRLLRACFKTCYIKRDSNLMLIMKSGEDIAREDFTIAVKELFDMAKTAGIPCGIRIGNILSLSNEEMIEVFEYCQKTLWEAFETGSEVRIIWN